MAFQSKQWAQYCIVVKNHYLLYNDSITEAEGGTLTLKYERKRKESLPVLAICYDFDKTLSPDNMQAQGIFNPSALM